MLRCCDAAKAEPEASLVTSYYSVSTSGRVDQARIGVRYQAVISQQHKERQELLVATSASATTPAHWCEGAAFD
jgi:hypothetical protein